MSGTSILVVIAVFIQQPPAAPAKPATVAGTSLARKVPDATVFFRCADAAATDKAWKALAISKLAEDPEVKEFLSSNPEIGQMYAADPFSMLKVKVAEGAPEFPVQIFNDLAGIHAEGESAFAVRTKPGQSDPEIYATMGLGSSVDAFDRAVDKLFEWLQTQKDEVTARRVSVDGMSFIEVGGANDDDDAEPGSERKMMRIARRGTTACFAGPTREAMMRLLLPATGASLADSPNFAEADNLLSSRTGSMYVYVDGPSVLAHLFQENGARHSLKALGLEKMRWAGLTFEPDGEFMRHRIEVRTDGANSVLELFSTKETFELEQIAPPRTVFFMQGAIDGKRIVAGMQKMNALYNKEQKSGDTYRKAMASMRGHVGTDFDELATLVGDEAAFAVTMPDAGIMPDVYLFIRAAGIDQATQLAGIVENAVRRVTKTPLSETPYLGKRVVYCQSANLGPMRPSLAVDGDRVVIASSVLSMKRYLKFRSEGIKGLSENPSFKESISALPSKGCTGYAWVDWPTIAKFSYEKFADFGPILGELGMRKAAAHDEMEEEEEPDPAQKPSHPKSRPEVSAGAGFDFNKLPTSEAVVRYIRPQAVRVKVGTAGASFESRAIF